MNVDFESYQYYRDKYVSAAATIKRQFPKWLTDPDLAAAVAAACNAERAIEARVRELASQEGDDS